jgi:hypothetical protein
MAKKRSRRLPARLNIKAFGLAGGVLWAIGILIWAVAARQYGWATEWVPLLGSGYIGFNLTTSGIAVGMVWGFIDAGLGCAIFAWLYNKLAKRFSK